MKKKDYAEVSRILLEEYYDSRYSYQIDEIKEISKISNDNIEKASKELMEIKERFINNISK